MLNILIPVDFSETSYNALRYALAFQKDFPFTITCMYAYENKKPKRRVEKLRAAFPGEYDLEFKKGDLLTAYDKIVKEIKVGMILMWTKGAQGLKKFIGGSNASKLMFQTDKPILIIPEESKYESIQKILWASDFKPIINPKALDLIKDLAKKTESTVRIAHVKTSDKKSESSQRSEKRWEDKFFGKEIKHSFKKIRRSSVSKGIKYYLEKRDDNNLLVLVRREYGFLDKLFRKNHAEEFAQEPTLPVLIIHE